MSRAQTLVLALLVLHLLLGGLCLAIARGEHKAPALRAWGWGLLLYAFGLLATVAALVLPRAVALVAGNTLITLSAVLCAAGVLRYTPVRLDRRWVGLGVAATVAVLAAANFLGVRTAIVNVGAPTALAAILFLFAAAVVARQGPRDARAACRFLAGILVFAVATWIARFGTMVPLLGGADDMQRVDLAMSLFAILQMVNGVAATLALIWIDVRLMQAELGRVADTDALTGLPNRRAIRIRFSEEAARAARHGGGFAFALFDIDHFKQVNDRHGHAMGDEVLKAVTLAIATAKRAEDVLGRIGGEEFLVILAHQSMQGACEAAERLRRAVRDAQVAMGAEPVSVTVSGGVALYPADGRDWDHLFAAADRRLYIAKSNGRDRVACEG